MPATPPGETPLHIDDETLRVVANRIAARAHDYGFGSAAPGAVRLRPFGEASSYPLYLAEIGPERAVVKFAPVYSQHREGQAEFSNLQAMAARLGRTGPLRVPRPLDYWEDVNALVMEYRPGTRFSERILTTPPWFMSWRKRLSLSRTSRQCGEWLRIYHEATARDHGPAIDDHFLARLSRDIDRIPSRGALAAMRAPIEEAFAAARETLVARRVPVAIRHGDYCPDNVQLDGDGICVFDLSHHLPAPVHDDVTYFLVTLDTMNPYPRYLAFDRRVARALAEPFLDGYYGEQRARREREDDPVLGAYTLKNLLTRCLRQRRVAAAAGPLALAAFDNIWVAGHYRDLFNRAIERVTRRP